MKKDSRLNAKKSVTPVFRLPTSNRFGSQLPVYWKHLSN
jgi:hypothetical protein